MKKLVEIRQPPKLLDRFGVHLVQLVQLVQLGSGIQVRKDLSKESEIRKEQLEMVEEM
jgi:hypothetical protein